MTEWWTDCIGYYHYNSNDFEDCFINTWDSDSPRMIKIVCLHEKCSSCNGTGIKKNGLPCIHMISCPCPKCSPRM